MTASAHGDPGGRGGGLMEAKRFWMELLGVVGQCLALFERPGYHERHNGVFDQGLRMDTPGRRVSSFIVIVDESKRPPPEGCEWGYELVPIQQRDI